MNLLKDLKMFFFYFNFFMVYTIHKILVFHKNHLNYLKDNTLECFFSQHIMMENPRSEEEKIIKSIRNLFRLRKELNYTAIKRYKMSFYTGKKN